jgi:hypothetical protein
MICLLPNKLLPLILAVLPGIMFIGRPNIFFAGFHESVGDMFNGFMLFLSCTWFVRSITFALNMTAIQALSAA